MSVEGNKPFYVYQIFDNDNVIYIGKGTNNRVNASLRERCGTHFEIVKRFEHEHKAFEYERSLIATHNNLKNKNKGGFGGCVLKGDKDTRLMQEIGTRAFAARMLLNYYLTFKALASKVDKYYSKEIQAQFNTMNPYQLAEIGYGKR